MRLSALMVWAAVDRAAGSLTYRGVDWSSAAVEEKAGVSYKTASGVAAKLEDILVASGVNAVRQRVWVNPAGGAYDLNYNVALAKRAKAAGLAVYLDLHFSDTWADPGHQTPPRAWPKDVEGLTAELYNYTRLIADTFQANSLPPAIISIGNEIRAGLLWPAGSTSSFANIARLLHAAAQGIRDSGLDPRPQIMIHLDNGWSWTTQQHFYTTALAQGSLASADFDMMGVSYYPFYGSGATLASLNTSLANMASTWGKTLVVAETDWPTSCPSPSQSFPSDVKSIPFSPAGQAKWIAEVAAVVAGVKNGKGVGVFYWEPAWVANANLGSSCANNLMFSSSGQALSSMSVFSTI